MDIRRNGNGRSIGSDDSLYSTSCSFGPKIWVPEIVKKSEILNFADLFSPSLLRKSAYAPPEVSIFSSLKWRKICEESTVLHARSLIGFLWSILLTKWWWLFCFSKLIILAWCFACMFCQHISLIKIQHNCCPYYYAKKLEVYHICIDNLAICRDKNNAKTLVHS